MKRDFWLMCRQPDTDTFKTIFEPLGRRRILRGLGVVALGAWLGAAGGLAEAKAESKPPEEEGDGGPEYVKLDWFMVQARQSDGRRRNLALLLTIELTEGGDRVVVAGHRRQLRDAYLQALSSPPLVRAAGDRIDMMEVKTRLARASAGVLGDDVVEDVLIRNISDFGAR